MATTTTSTDRIVNRAPKGGAVSPVNGKFYAGGQFMPMVAEVVEVKPAPLEGSSRQVLWAARLRREALAELDAEITVRVSFLNDGHREARAIRETLRGMLITRYDLLTERSAARVIEARARA